MTLPTIAHALALIVLAAITAQTIANLATLPRLGAGATRRRRGPSAAVLIPARNEAEGIGACLRAWAAQDYPDFEIVVYDDDSTDDTLARAAAIDDLRIRLVRGGALPSRWRGKAHACHCLRTQTRAAVLVFADVDVLPHPAALNAAVAALDALHADALSALPRHTGSVAVRALVALQNWAPVAFAPLWLSRRPRPLVVVLNGQFIAMRAEAYDAAGGFAAVRASVAEDAALGRRLAASGAVVALVDASAVLTCTPYRSLGEAWEAHVRNLRGAFFDSSALLLAAVGALAVLTLGPPALLVGGVLAGRGGTLTWTWVPLAEATLGLLSRALSDARAGYGLGLVVWHPLAVLALAVMALDAATRVMRGRPVTWRGRRYRLGDTVD